MAKVIYVFLLFLLLTLPYSFASEDDESDDVEDDHPGYCGGWSGEFHGACMDWRKGECNASQYKRAP
ncbi:hypothetical protein SUGI_0917700 [Cryptomeria japonica]|nr:hypothetical protein SUGI_0917700 [Cryptomeria japonica]